jgi:hypothetical protein
MCTVAKRNVLRKILPGGARLTVLILQPSGH